MLKKSSSVSIVNRSRHGTHRENSLYHFLNDNLSTILPAGYRARTSRSDRQALYIDLPLLSEECETIFLGFNLVRQHLSVDRYVINDSSPLSRHFSPSHGTFVYENLSERLILHVYFNRVGQFIDFKLKTHPISLTSGASVEGVERELTFHEKKLAREQAEPCQALLSRLLNHKSTEYIALYQSSFQLDKELSSAYVSKKRRVIISKTEELIALTSKLSRYNDMETDGRTSYLTRMLTTLKEEQTSNPMETHRTVKPDVEPELQLRPIQSDKKKAPPKTIQQNLTEDIVLLVDEVVHLTDAMPEQSICQQVLTHESQLRQLDDLFLLLELNTTHHENQAFIHEQRNRLPINKNLCDYFNDCVLTGDVESVSILYPTFSQRLNMYHLSEMLISVMISKREQSPQLIRVADFFYEQSELYRSFISLKSQMLKFSSEKKIGFGFVFCFFHAVNFDAFSMALRHGVSPDASQLIKNEKTFNLLQALIIHYSSNPNIDYIHALFESGAEVDFPTMQSEIASLSMVKKTFKDSASLFMKHKKINLLSTEDDHDEVHFQYHEASQKKHALTLACSLHAHSHPHLIQTIAYHSSPEMVLLETSLLLNLSAFNSRFIPLGPHLCGKILNSKDACDIYTKEILESTEAYKCSFLFYMKNGITTEADQHLFDSANHLFRIAIDSYSSLPSDEQRQIIRNLSARAMQLKNSNKYTDAIASYKSVQLAYTMMINPRPQDHQVMVYSFAQIASLIKTHLSSPAQLQAIYIQAAEFLKYLPESEFELMKDLPVVQFIQKKIKATEYNPAIAEACNLTIFSVSKMS